MHIARRTLLGAVAGSAALGAVAGASPAPADAAEVSAAAAALARLLPRHRQQVAFRTVARKGGADAYRVTGRTGRITVEGTTPAVQLTGFHRYLRRTAHAHFSWNGEQTALPDRLPAPAAPVTGTANAVHRFVLNDTSDGYTGPYRDWAAWEREIDVLALHGFNEVLVYAGADAVYHRTFLEHGYGDAELRDWIPGPAHQPWWLLQNMASFGGPVSDGLLARRTALAQRIVDRLRELGMTPVLPGWFGTVPPDFALRNPGARVVPQGDWGGGFRRPDWLDPRTPHFARVARTFYRVQEELLGAAPMYKMDLLHEGGTPGDVPVSDAARAVEEALQSARPGAVWAILGWQENPRREILDAVDRSKMLVLDGLSDRFPKVTDREADWGGTPYAFGSIWNFGGHTAMGANTPDWAALYDRWRTKPGSALRGIALMPEATGNNPAALALFSDLAWTDGPTDLAAWFRQWSVTRYGAADPHAARAWDVLRRTAYGTTRADSWSEAADGLFGARPDLAVTHAGTWSPRRLRYDAAEFEKALPALLAVAPGLRGSSAYRYDLMDVARQCIANRSRLLLPRIKAAHDAGDRARFDGLTRQWLDWMTLLDQVTATDAHHLLGRWAADARAWGSTPAERDTLEYDAVSLLTIWGPRAAADGGELHDYANREWAGLIGGLYRLRWKTYFTELSDALAAGRSPKPVDWFALEERWTRERPPFPSSPRGDIVRIARTVASRL
ncbi:alpha-N-acetylglucosaminidase [Streptomyces sp. NPDC001404]|uniref:alpha-N-acetylglucosaminidase n=1 Tax=Streptomyces sp. NPDC001404 TaxID=3364571 RepID=UPI0036BC6449